MFEVTFATSLDNFQRLQFEQYADAVRSAKALLKIKSVIEVTIHHWIDNEGQCLFKRVRCLGKVLKVR